MVIFDINLKNKFLEHNYISIIKMSSNPTIAGFMVNKNLRETLLSSIGEFKERQTLYSYGTFVEGGKIKLLNLYDGSIEERLYSKEIAKFFFDSTGCACHTNSERVVDNAFFEFIERQFYIFTYLTKSEVKLLEFNFDIEDIIPHKYKHLNYYNLSPIDSLFVILVYGWIEGKIYISLGASNSLGGAIKKAIKEIEQLSHVYSSGSHQKISKEISYFNIFMSIPDEKLKKSFQFLQNASCYNVNSNELKIQFKFEDILKDLKKEYGIEPKLVFIDNDFLKVAKVLDFNWFPSLLPRMASSNNIAFIESKTGRNVDRQCNFIPFP